MLRAVHAQLAKPWQGVLKGFAFHLIHRQSSMHLACSLPVSSSGMRISPHVQLRMSLRQTPLGLRNAAPEGEVRLHVCSDLVVRD